MKDKEARAMLEKIAKNLGYFIIWDKGHINLNGHRYSISAEMESFYNTQLNKKLDLLLKHLELDFHETEKVLPELKLRSTKPETSS